MNRQPLRACPQRPPTSAGPRHPQSTAPPHRRNPEAPTSSAAGQPASDDAAAVTDLPAATRAASGRSLTPTALSDAAQRQPTRDEKTTKHTRGVLDPAPLLQG